MRTRSKAIQNATGKYNKAARELNPPRPPLDWTTVCKYNFVEEFQLLRYARHNVRHDRWSDGEVREAMKMNQRIKRAQEEIDRVHVEMRRLFTWISDEHDLFAQTRQALAEKGDVHLLQATVEFCTKRERVNRQILVSLEAITDLEGYTGVEFSKLRGVAIGASKVSDVDYNMRMDPGKSEGDDSDDDSAVDEEEDVQLGGVVDFLSAISLS